MAGSTSSIKSPGDVFDVRKIRRLVELMNEHELAEIDLRQGEQRIRLRKGHLGEVFVGSAPHGPPPAAVSPPLPAGDQPPARPVAAEDTSGTFITSPMVGTFYLSPNPDAAPFIKVGDQVGPDSTVCIIEAMKVFNEIQAECSGRVVAFLVENGAAVEYGQKLFRIEP
jgi:acetyl-CoA carboxylase biotin carboxyl carrier protein